MINLLCNFLNFWNSHLKWQTKQLTGPAGPVITKKRGLGTRQHPYLPYVMWVPVYTTYHLATHISNFRAGISSWWQARGAKGSFFTSEHASNPFCLVFVVYILITSTEHQLWNDFGYRRAYGLLNHSTRKTYSIFVRLLRHLPNLNQERELVKIVMQTSDFICFTENAQ